MAKAQWPLVRAERLETVAFDLLTSPASGSGDPDIRIVNAILASGCDALGSFKRYAAKPNNPNYRAYRELAAAKKIQNEANLVAKLDANLARRVIMASLPSNPAYGSPYGNNAKSPVQNKPNPAASIPAKPSLRSQYPENLALCL
jgi:hypothetical protein